MCVLTSYSEHAYNLEDMTAKKPPPHNAFTVVSSTNTQFTPVDTIL